MRALGIDFGEDSIKIVELNQTKKNIYVSAVYEKKLSAEVSEHDREIEAIEYVRQTLSRIDISNVRIVTSLKQDKVTVRKKQFPFADRSKILKSLSFEMEEDIPFDPDLCLFDSKAILYEGFSAHVLAIAAPKSHIEKSLSLAKDFGIEPYTLTVDGLAFTNLVEDLDGIVPTYPADTGPFSNPTADDPENQVLAAPTALQITLNIGHKRTLLCAQIDQRVVSVRSLMWGADFIIQEIVRKYQVPYVEAQKILQTQASLLLVKTGQDYDTANLASTIEKPLREFIRDLQMSFLEIKSEFLGEIQSVQLSGGLSLLPNIGAFLTQNLEVACNTVSLVDRYLDPTKANTFEIPLESIQTRFASAIGIALEAFKKPRNPALQFMKGEFAGDNNKLNLFWQNWGAVLQIAAAGLIVFFTWGSLRETFSTDLATKGEDALKQQAKSVARLPNRQANERGVKKYITDNKKKAQEFKSLSKVASLNSPLDILKQVSEASPSKDQVQIDLTSFEIKDDLVKIAGYATSPREVTLLSQRLSTLAVDKKTKEEAPHLPATPNKVAFSISFKTDRGLQ